MGVRSAAHHTKREAVLTALLGYSSLHIALVRAHGRRRTCTRQLVMALLLVYSFFDALGSKDAGIFVSLRCERSTSITVKNLLAVVCGLFIRELGLILSPPWILTCSITLRWLPVRSS